MGSEEREFDIGLGAQAWIAVRKRPDPERGLDWSAVLRVRQGQSVRTVCVYDNSHGAPERHRFHRGVKQSAEAVPAKGAARLDLPAAIAEIKKGWEGMVERWEP
jgi:hypothetical protein